MTQTEDSGSAAPRQPDPLCMLLPMGWWFELPDTWANRRGAMILLCGLRRRVGWPLYMQRLALYHFFSLSLLGSPRVRRLQQRSLQK
jgi:hypothetical protein